MLRVAPSICLRATPPICLRAATVVLPSYRLHTSHRIRPALYRWLVRAAGSAKFDDAERLLATAQDREPPLKEIVAVEQLLLILDAHIVEVYTARFDRLPRFGD